MDLSRIDIEDGARIAVIGGGPAASFFAITLLREARRLGLRPSVRIFERRSGMTPGDARLLLPTAGCNYCAGGISPRMSDVLDELGIDIPPEVVKDRMRTITVQSHWKNIELPVPDDRRMYTVYRGARPMSRAFRLLSFDSVLLDAAAREGVEVVKGEVTGLTRSDRGKPVLRWRAGSAEAVETLEADFAVFAGGVNRKPGGSLDRTGLHADLGRMMPGFAPPAVRRTLIFEVELSEELAASMKGELTFVLFGSPELRLDMGSVMPKGRFATVALIGPDIDGGRSSRPAGEIVNTFLSLPHIERVLPRHLIRGVASCICRPNMVVGCAENPVGDRIGVIGDMVTSRLYKDGIYTAYLTGSGLARAALGRGVDAASLRKGYLPLIRRLEADLRSGRNVFRDMSLAFRNPILSRMIYQAVIRERRTLPRGKRRLERILWRVASGDESYAGVHRAMLDPRAVLSFLVRGALLTVRNRLTELLFGLRWRGLGRFPTGVSREDMVKKVREWESRLGTNVARFRDFRRMYTIRIRAPATRIVRELGRMGDADKEFLRPRFVDVRRIRGAPNEPGSILRYSVRPKPLSFRMVLSKSDPARGLVYRVMDGFARGGVLILDVETKRPKDCLLSIFVGFDFARGTGPIAKVIWNLYRWIFPTFVHDVLWNHALCRIKRVAERPTSGSAVPFHQGLHPDPDQYDAGHHGPPLSEVRPGPTAE